MKLKGIILEINTKTWENGGTEQQKCPDCQNTQSRSIVKFIYALSERKVRILITLQRQIALSKKEEL